MKQKIESTISYMQRYENFAKKLNQTALAYNFDEILFSSRKHY